MDSLSLNRTRKCTCCGGRRHYVVVHPVSKDEKAGAWAVCQACDLTPQSTLKPNPAS